MKKIVINNCYGGFNLSDKAIERLSCTDNPTKIWDIARDNSTLVSLVEELGEEANGKYSELKIVEIPDDVEWHIVDIGGNEYIAENHRIWS
jgi:hypothetical protein